MVEPIPELSPPGVGTSAAGRKEALERRRRRLLESAGLDGSTKQQAEIDLPATDWRPVRWSVETRWKPAVARAMGLPTNRWESSNLWISCTTECMARNACERLRKGFPGKSYRYRPSRWRTMTGNEYPPQVPTPSR